MSQLMVRKKLKIKLELKKENVSSILKGKLIKKMYNNDCCTTPTYVAS